jgi:FkbM family methyltransferase
VIAFEAIVENADILRHNVALNGLEHKIVVEQCAVSDGSTQEVRLTLPETFTLEWTLTRQQGARSRDVPAIALDQYFPPGQRVDLVKMDIEGAEALAISGMQRILQQSHPLLLIELHGQEGLKAAGILERLGYQLLDVERRREYIVRSDSPLPHHIIAQFG